MLQAHFARVSTHEEAFSSSLNLPRELAPKYLTCLISWSILRGGNSALEDEVYPWNRWYTRRSFAPGSCPWSMLRSKIPSMHRPLKTWKWPTESSLRGTPQFNIRFWQCQSSARGSRRAVKSRTKKILTDDQAELIAARVSFNLISDFLQPKLAFFFFRTLVWIIHAHQIQHIKTDSPVKGTDALKTRRNHQVLINIHFFNFNTLYKWKQLKGWIGG